MSQTIAAQVLSYVEHHEKGKVFTPSHLAEIGPLSAVNKALQRLAAQGTIVRIARGLYHVPKVSPVVGPMAPSPRAIAEAIAEARGEQLQVTGAQAANALGLTQQVPARAAFYLPTRVQRKTLAGLNLEIRPAGRRRMAGAGTVAGTILQGLRYLGPEEVGPAAVAQIRSLVPRRERLRLRKHVATAPEWMRPHLRAIIASPQEHR